jgi:AcrR family transcriptional regulator
VQEEQSVRRKPRADAERNRLRLLETAKAVFAERGADATLEEIARRTGVGIGTLYRHFPTREALLGGIYRNETEQIAAAAVTLAETKPPLEALHAWLHLFVDYIATKHGVTATFAALSGGGAELQHTGGEQIITAIRLLTDRAVAAGAIRLEMDPVEMLRILGGGSGRGEDWRLAARQLVPIIIAGIRTGEAG